MTSLGGLGELPEPLLVLAQRRLRLGALDRCQVRSATFPNQLDFGGGPRPRDCALHPEHRAPPSLLEKRNADERDYTRCPQLPRPASLRRGSFSISSTIIARPSEKIPPPAQYPYSASTKPLC